MNKPLNTTWLTGYPLMFDFASLQISKPVRHWPQRASYRAQVRAALRRRNEAKRKGTR